MLLLPHIEIDLPDPIRDGKLYKANIFCKKKANFEKCRKFIETIKSVSGFYICPYGFTCYVKHQDNNLLITCSIRVRGHYSAKKANPKIHPDDSPILADTFVLACVNESMEGAFLRTRVSEVKEFLEVTLHEIRKLNRDIKSQAEELNIAFSESNTNKNFIQYRIQNIFGTSSLISVRLDTFDVLFNPELISSNTPISFYTYRKFEKTMHCLDNLCKQNRVQFRTQGTNYDSLEAYPVLELLPYVLLENAIKYSPENNIIEVIYDSDEVVIKNVGPYLSKGEVSQIFKRKYRGKHSENLFSGTGNGLFFAKQVCDIHGIEIIISASDTILYRLNQIPYANFQVTLRFHYQKDRNGLLTMPSS